MSLNNLPEARMLERVLSISQPCTQVSAILAEMSVSPGSTSEVGIRSFRLRVVSPTGCSPTSRVDSPASYMSVRLRFIC